MTEEWRAIKGLEGFYEVSNLGRVKRLYREHHVKGNTYIVSEKIIEPILWQSRYLRVDCIVKRNNKIFRRNAYIHKLVMESFVGDRPKGLVIDHLDGNFTNNCLSNLRYCTISENLNNINTKPIIVRTEEQKQKISNTLLNKHAKGMTNGKDNKFVSPDEQSGYLLKGWKYGITRKK